MLKSLFGLIKSNNGRFKSEKQAQYLLSRMEGGLYVERSVLHFGEHEGRSSRNTASIEWEFHCTPDGIQSVYKTTSKGRAEYWANTHVYHAEASAKQQLKIKETLLSIAEAKAHSQERIDQLFKEYAILESPALANDSRFNPELISQLRANQKARINDELSSYQQWAIDSKIAYYESLAQVGTDQAAA